MSKLSWDKLTPRIRRSCAKPPGIRPPCNASSGRSGKASEEKVVAAGAGVIKDIDKTAFVEAMAPVYEKYVGHARGQGSGQADRAVTCPAARDLPRAVTTMGA